MRPVAMSTRERKIKLARQNGKIDLGDLRVPVPLVFGFYEELTKEELDDHYKDINAERDRRDNESSDSAE